METHLQNLASLHGYEESLRPQNLAPIEKSAVLSDHYKVVGEAMNVLHALTKLHVHKSDDELTMQFLGIRVMNAAAVSIKLALSGYYQAAFVHVRDILETQFLMDYLLSNKSEIAEWKTADRKKLKTRYAPFTMREALDARDGATGKKRGEIYALLSSHASHATYRGFQLTTKNNLGEIGPFVDEKQLVAWLEEMAKHLGLCAAIYAGHFPDVSSDLVAVKAHYDKIINAWMSNYLQGKYPSTD